LWRLPPADDEAVSREPSGTREIADLSPGERRAVAVYRAIDRALDEHRALRLALAGLLVVLGLGVSALILTLPYLGVDQEAYEEFGYLGVFVANLLSTATVFIPVPGLTVAGQALIVDQADELNWILVGVLGGIGMGLGEVTAYVTGLGGGTIARGRTVGGPAWFRSAVEGTARWVGWWMRHYGAITLFVLAVIPEPIFELAAMAAGASGFGFKRYMAIVLAGNILRGLILAGVGAHVLTAY
jgi:membrane protein DedA with SNARE-associated domain